jgi:crotonobetainyl-CoA:carnitine CoA-transferase CaiB-like acyl-CoA transferase
MSDAVLGPWVEREGALSGLRVLDLTRILSGPFASMVLADLGADVVKVEDTKAGDDTRSWGPPFHGEDAAYFHAVNRNKRSLAIDLKSDVGQQVVLSLADTADVVIENFRPGTADRLGLGYDVLSERNPAVVYASISGFGHSGPLSRRAGYDAIAQAMSGVMSVTGEPDGDAVRFGVASADLAAGMWATIGILAALQSRERTGRGQHIDISLLDGQLSWLSYVAQGFFATGVTPPRYGSAHPNIVPYQGFATADGDIMIAVGNDDLFRRFCEALGEPGLADDPRFRSNPNRVNNREELLPIIEKLLGQRTAAEWADLLTIAGIPAGPIHTVDEALGQEQAQARDMVVTLPHATEGNITTLGSPLKLSADHPRLRHASPTHGEHTAEILHALGMTEDDLARWRRDGVVK